jgi:hypothetical protein
VQLGKKYVDMFVLSDAHEADFANRCFPARRNPKHIFLTMKKILFRFCSYETRRIIKATFWIQNSGMNYAPQLSYMNKNGDSFEIGFGV